MHKSKLEVMKEARNRDYPEFCGPRGTVRPWKEAPMGLRVIQRLIRDEWLKEYKAKKGAK
jgi:hypothetical protein